MLTSRLKILPADKSFKKIITKDANPDLINLYKQKFEEAIDNGDKEEMKRWFREIMNHVSFTDAEFQSIGKHNDTPDDQFDAEELAKGIKVEMEHTDDEEMAKSIAKDHLAEIPDYYTRLLKMEAEAKGKTKDDKYTYFDPYSWAKEFREWRKKKGLDRKAWYVLMDDFKRDYSLNDEDVDVLKKYLATHATSMGIG